MKLSKDQIEASNSILDWYNKSNVKTPYITLGGYAGSGKTTLISNIAFKIGKIKKATKIAFCSYTGKAAQVLKQKLFNLDIVRPWDSVSTIHSLIYSPVLNSKEQIVGWQLKDELKADLIIIDEASMINAEIWRDLTSYGVPIIAVGDHGQLPPIQGRFSLMKSPMLKLENIHRQARDNPIIKWSQVAREYGEIPILNESSPSGVFRKFSKGSTEGAQELSELLETYDQDMLILCGYNKTRVNLNKHIRSLQGFYSDAPECRDRVICLRNNHEKKIFNGMLGNIMSINEVDNDWFNVQIELDGEDEFYEGIIPVKQFNNPTSLNFTSNRAETVRGDLFDFGYALTVHKAQGSQSPRVLLFEERFRAMDDDMWRRWLYTGITRAGRELYIAGR